MSEIDARIWQAVVAGVFVAFGWIVNGWQNRRLETRRRAERLRDVHRALYAEIKQNLRNLGSPEDLARYGETMMDRTVSEDGFIPFVAHESNDRVFATILPDLQILPRSSIDVLVEYYGHVAALDALIGDLRGEAVRKLEPERRAQVYADYIGVKIRLVRFGRDAMLVIDTYSKEGAEAARDLADRLEAERSASC